MHVREGVSGGEMSNWRWRIRCRYLSCLIFISLRNADFLPAGVSSDQYYLSGRMFLFFAYELTMTFVYDVSALR
jgi:hypothetical protein